MKCYTFSYGVDGFGYDIAPAFEEGIYTNYEQAFQHLCELNRNLIKEQRYFKYERGYGEDYYPPTNKILEDAQKKEDWDAYDEELQKHIIRDVKKICEAIVDDGEPPFGLYCMHETELK